MFLVRILIMVTVLVVAGYFIQFSAQRAEGFLKPFGKYLSLWVFVLAGLIVITAAVQPALGNRGAGFGRGGPGIARGFGPRQGAFPVRRFRPGFGRQFERRGAPPAETDTPAQATPPAPTTPAAP